MLPVQNPGKCTCVSPDQPVPESAVQHPLRGLHTSHRMKTFDRGARWSTREQGTHLSTEGGRHSPSGSSTTTSPPVRSARVTEPVWFSTLWSDGHFRQWEKRDDFIIAHLETADIHWEFGRIMEINMAELVVLKSQLLRLIIMTDREIYCILKQWRTFLLVSITFPKLQK